mgnify:CR=1 FL=1
MWLHTTGYNSEVTFVLLTNLNRSQIESDSGMLIPNNVRLAQMPLDDVSERIRTVLPLNFTIKNVKLGYKLCDYRPMLRLLMEPELQSYGIKFTHWGWTDLDMINGNIMDYAQYTYEDEDAIAFSPDSVSNGPLTIMKDNKVMNNKWIKVPFMADFLTRKKATYIEEVFFNQVLKDDNITVNHNEKYGFDCSSRAKVIWYQGKLKKWKATKGNHNCVLMHYGGGRTADSRRKKKFLIEQFSDYFSEGYYKNKDIGFAHDPYGYYYYFHANATHKPTIILHSHMNATTFEKHHDSTLKEVTTMLGQLFGLSWPN